MKLLSIEPQHAWQVGGWTMCYFLLGGMLVALAGSLLRFAMHRAAPQIRYSLSLVVFAVLALLPAAIAM